jgi:hypothetical protein
MPGAASTKKLLTARETALPFPPRPPYSSFPGPEADMPESSDLVTRILEKFAKGEVPAAPRTGSGGGPGHAWLADDPPWCESCPCVPCVPPMPDIDGRRA